jgi:hypothetical protein
MSRGGGGTRGRRCLARGGLVAAAVGIALSAAIVSGVAAETYPPLARHPEGIADRREVQRRLAAQRLWGRDPFTRSTSTNLVNGLSLSGILWDVATPMAIINGQTFQVGDECDGYRIVEIAPTYVAVTDEIQTFQLQIAP